MCLINCKHKIKCILSSVLTKVLRFAVSKRNHNIMLEGALVTGIFQSTDRSQTDLTNQIPRYI